MLVCSFNLKRLLSCKVLLQLVGAVYEIVEDIHVILLLQQEQLVLILILGAGAAFALQLIVDGLQSHPLRLIVFHWKQGIIRNLHCPKKYYWLAFVFLQLIGRLVG